MPELLGVAYLLIGFALFGNWKKSGFGGKFLYFVFFPFHLLLCTFLGAVVGGITEYASVWKLVFGWLLIIFLVLVSLSAK